MSTWFTNRHLKSTLNASEFNDDLNIDPKYSSKMPSSKYDPRAGMKNNRHL